MAYNYSRLARVEEKRNIQRTIILTILSVLFLAILVVWGIPLIIRFATFIGDLNGGGNPVAVNDTTPPAPPRVNPLSEYTNNQELELTGSAEPGAAVIFDINGRKSEIVANSQGEFNLSISLVSGENKISAVAVDGAKNKSQQTVTQTIIFDNEKPKLDIGSPSDGQEFYGLKQKYLNIQGTTEPEVNLTINGKYVRVGDNGGYNHQFTLNEGENMLEFKASDKAGNTEEKVISVKFTP